MKKQLLDKDCVSAINDSLKRELGHFYMYKYLSNAMQMIGYFGAQKYFSVESSEEEGHYQKHIDFLNDMGVLGTLPTLTPIRDVVNSLKSAVEIAYSNELDLLDFYKELYSKKEEEYPEVAEHLLFYLKTQRDAVGFYGDLLSRIELSGTDNAGLLIIDKELKELSK